MVRNWERVLLGNIFFNSQMHFFSVILTPWNWNFSATLVPYTGLRKNSRKILKRIQTPYESIEIWEGVPLKLVLRIVVARCLPFCWPWPEGLDIPCKYLKKISCKFQENVCFLNLFCWWKITFKSSLELQFHPLIVKFRIEEKIHTKAVVDVLRGTAGRIFLGETWGGW